MQSYLDRRDNARLLTLSRFMRGVIWIYIAVWGAYALASGWLLSLVFMGKTYGPVWMMTLGLRGIIGLLGFIIFLICLPPFLMWFNKALSNLHEAGLTGLTARPTWTTASFFVPVANLFIPFTAMRELWNRSHGEDEWQAKASVSEVSIWWTCLLAGTLLVSFISVIGIFNYFTNLKIITPMGVNHALNLSGVCLWIVSALFLLRIIANVSNAQQALSDERATFA
ncbi:DUF4328 domain-containing protein [Novosphingobium beihaiensis]|uniref:DUF4328 domain-containing protein n=1 Tax=Novosphingobium beihaiensis TaxID=2930389 RepID=A0ABT0BM52_9SPHN|nr:DUF4328 domain-containing protein [Novosphingobium beihaiensis]MCJ2185911.1 DUF4328 domain-containing protein [Novosphingobium beihaiensis]